MIILAAFLSEPWFDGPHLYAFVDMIGEHHLTVKQCVHSSVAFLNISTHVRP
jgi:hypothetical protein